MKKMLSPDELLEIFRYDPETGNLFWAKRLAPRCVGLAGSKQRHCIEVRVFGRSYPVHRIAMAITNGRWPKNVVDHINGDPFDNRISNLREATHRQNMANRKSAKGSMSPFLGVTLSKGRWVAQCRTNGKRMKVEGFSCHAAAAKAYDKMAVMYHGEFARPNFPALLEEQK